MKTGFGYLRGIDQQDEAMIGRLVPWIAAKEGISEKLKVENQMIWVQRMNTVREAAEEIADKNLLHDKRPI